jgi:hypothetical protein
MGERLLGVGADLSRVYVCDDDGTALMGADWASVFHRDDLPGRSGFIAAGVARAAGVPVADLLAAWQFVQRLRASVGDGFAMMPDAVTCPVCGSVEVSGWEFDAADNQAWQEVSCDDCGSRWNDVYAMVGRAEVVRGDRAPRVAVPSEPGLADHLDAAYEDANGCGVEL